MRVPRIVLALAVTFAFAAPAVAGDMKMSSSGAAAGPAWSMNATAIEACSCPAFCQCYFNTSPSGHSEHAENAAAHEHGGSDHFCRFNNAYKVNKGTYGTTKLDGAKFWIYGDLGGDFTKGMDWAVVTFDKGTSKEQREAIGQICAHLFPVHWNSLTTAEGDITWNATKDQAYALLDDGKTAEVRIAKFKGMTDAPVVINNLPYWGAPRNTGFIVMPNSVNAVRVGDKQFEFHGSNGFMITLDIDSKTAPPAATGM